MNLRFNVFIYSAGDYRGIIEMNRFPENSTLSNPLLKNPYHSLFYNAIDGEDWEDNTDYMIDRNDRRWQNMVNHRFELSDNGVDIDEFEYVINLGKYSGYLEICPHYVFDHFKILRILKKFEFYYNDSDDLILKTPVTENGLIIRFCNKSIFEKCYGSNTLISEHSWHTLTINKSHFKPDML